MKKAIALTLIISLVMCLFMAFPASAAVTIVDNASIGQVYPNMHYLKNNLSLYYPSGYDYIMFYSTKMASNWSYREVHFVVANSPTVSNGSQFYRGKVTPTTISHYSLDSNKLCTMKTTGYQTASIRVPYFWYRESGASADTSSGNIYGVFTELSTCNFANYSALYNYALAGGYDMEWHLEPLLDISALQALLSLAKSIQNNGYTQSSWNTLQIQITAAENLLASTGYTQDQINNMVNALQTAIDGLFILPDTTELQALLVIADEIQDDGYTRSTWNPFLTARTASHSLIASSFYTESEVSTSKTTLQTAIDNLSLLPDSSYLESLIEQAQTYIDDKYTELSLQILNSKIMQALILLEDKDYVAAQIDQMISDLQDAIINLVLLNPPEPEPDPPEIPDISIDNYMWELTPEQKKYANLLNGVTSQHLEPVKEGVEENISVARKYGFWVWLLILVPIVIVIIARSFLGSIGSNIQLDMTPHSSGGVSLTAWKHRRNRKNWEKKR